MTKRTGFKNRLLSAFMLAIFMLNMAPPVYGATDPGVMAELKSDVRQDDVDEAVSSSRKSNVLFMIEATAAMSFSPKGLVPQVMMVDGWDDDYVEVANWNKTKDKLGYSVEGVNRMMADATFGMGALPPAWSGLELRPERNLYGRDLDASNNFIATGKGISADIEVNKDRYYFPHIGKVNAINNDSYGHATGGSIYRGQRNGLEVGFENVPEVWPHTVHYDGSDAADATAWVRDFRASLPWGANVDLASYEGPARVNFYYDSRANPNDSGFYKSFAVDRVTGKPIGVSRGVKNDATHTVHTNGIGDQIIADYNYKDNTPQNTAFPYAMVFKDPQYWRTPPPAANIDASMLVPNDSRMYQTKLVLWRILQNRDLFKNMRIGLASTFLSPANMDRALYYYTHRAAWSYRTDYNGIFKVAPFGSNVYTVNFFKDGVAYTNRPEEKITNYQHWGWKPVNPNPPGSTGKPVVLSEMIDKNGNWLNGFKRIRYENGVMSGPFTGELENFSALHGQYFPLWQAAKNHSYYEVPKKRPVRNDNALKAIVDEEDGWWSVGWSIADGEYAPEGHAMAGEKRDRPLYKLQNRASLWVPILDYDHVWEKDKYTMTQADKIRMWIDGVADIRGAGETSADHKHTEKNHPYDGTYKDPYATSYGSGITGLNNHGGFGDARNSQFHFYRNPELGVAGSFTLAQAIFPDPTLNHPTKSTMKLELDRDFYYENNLVWFSAKAQNVNYRADYRRFSQEYDFPGVPKALFNADSGEAAGSVMDFFSPLLNKHSKVKGDTGSVQSITPEHSTGNTYSKVLLKGSGTGNGTDGKPKDLKGEITINDLADVSFPVKNKCENNWVLVIASGAEGKSPGAYTYPVWKAIDNLYKATDKKNKGVQFSGHRAPVYEPVTIISEGSGASRKFAQVDLDEPIRTLVVGIVANPNDPAIANDPMMLKQVKEMRLNLTKAAMAGQGRGAAAALLDEGNMHLAPVQPFFADDVESLMRGVTDALAHIERHTEQPAKGAMVEASALSDKLTGQGSNDREFDYYVANFLIRKDRQWDGLLSRYQVVEDSSGVLTPTKKWELNERITSQLSASLNDWRKLRYWKGGALANLTRGSDFEAMTGLTSANMYGVNGFIAVDNPLPQHSASDAMYDWLQGYDYSYLSKTHGVKLPRKGLLNDIGQGGVAFVSDPPPSVALPGYQEWASDAATRPQNARIYVQTNGGLLHVVDPLDGKEELAILPPPSLMPARLATLKTNRRGSPLTGDVKLQWINVRGKEADLGDGDISAQRGNPVYLLDGSLQKRFFAKTQTGFTNSLNTTPSWGSYLLGTLGRGGSGMYMMDVSAISSPKLLWYREKLGTKIMREETSASSSNQSPVEKAAETNDAYFLKLGFNSPQPAMGVAGSSDHMINFVAVTGGSQYDLNLADNGKEGAVLMMLDPKDGDILAAFDSDSLSSTSMKNGSAATGSTPYMGMMVSEPTLYRSEADAVYGAYITGHIYTADNRGNIFHVALERPDSQGVVAPLSPSQWNIRTVATLQANSNSANNYAVPFGLVADKVGGTMWLAGGTSNVPVRKQSGGDGYIANASQMLFAFATTAGQQSVYNRNNLHTLKATTDNDPPYDSNLYKGWRIPLEGESRSSTGRVIKYAEYVSAKPMLAGGIIFIPTFIPSGFTDKELNDPELYCQGGLRARGNARLYAIRLTDGTRWQGFNYKDKSKFIEIADAKITGLSVSNRGSVTRGIVTIDKLGKTLDTGSNLSTVIDNNNEVLVSFVAPTPPGGVNMEPGQNIIKYWITR